SPCNGTRNGSGATTPCPAPFSAHSARPFAKAPALNNSLRRIWQAPSLGGMIVVHPARLLGFAFANADLLFEVDEKGTIVFATGAASEFTRDKLVGEPAGRLFDADAARKFATHVKSLGRGGRAGPLKLKLAGGAEALLSLCQLPLNGGNISCTLSKPGARTSFGSDGKDKKTGLSDRDAF